MSSHNLSYETISDALLKIDATTEVPEAHGTLCGMICINGDTGLKNWLELIFDDQDPNNLSIKESRQILTELYDDTFEQLSDNDYNLELLIHDDEAPLDIRIEDLGLWCQGFLYGLSLAGLTDIKKLPTDASEILQDMSDISKAGYDPDEDEDANENAFAEIVEYIRIGTYVVYGTFNNSDAQTNTIH